MHIKINTGRNIEGREALAAEISGIAENALGRFSDQITRLEVHLSDENSNKKVGHGAMRCMMEARIEGCKPIAVTRQAASLDQAVNDASDTLARLIEHTLDRLREQQEHRTDPDRSILEPTIEAKP